ncbi:nuclease [Limnobaculum zhutongyuii]|uniref:phospholipase D n=1 Tax=Limnobaculum zhutongyuii TaxID=2498113 RepID=A0A411WHV3_9GAMM|nr:phospholipase D-like domain-containing protein [Limnobaculum zhutongyuii]QBH95860.1 nuclease [Limnobaculum zhutongyuii]TQS89432.1 nuclease [Limnobaculum zhutongyuii]
MDNKELEHYLESTLADLTLSQGERVKLRELSQVLDTEQSGFMRNRAFDLVRAQLNTAPENLQPVLKWLEMVIKTIDIANQRKKVTSSACFSPGDACRKKICEILAQTTSNVDICVFTIADDIITESILAAHQRQVQIRIITDNEKSEDDGSDIEYLQRKGISIVMDNSPYHMHHKFSIFDNRYLLNGSFNWTRSASQYNYENILITDSPTLLAFYQQEFNRLWQRFS